MGQGVSEPKCKAILLCNQTIMEAGTGNVSLIGVFSHMSLPKTPGKTQAAEAFLQITDAEGSYDLVIEIHDQSDQRIVARSHGSAIEIPHRLAYVNVIIPIPPLLIKHPGPYEFVVFANRIEIDRQQFQVIVPPDLEVEQDDQ